MMDDKVNRLISEAMTQRNRKQKQITRRRYWKRILKSLGDLILVVAVMAFGLFAIISLVSLF
jgi:hypothetical protein